MNKKIRKGSASASNFKHFSRSLNSKLISAKLVRTILHNPFVTLFSYRVSIEIKNVGTLRRSRSKISVTVIFPLFFYSSNEKGYKISGPANYKCDAVSISAT